MPSIPAALFDFEVGAEYYGKLGRLTFCPVAPSPDRLIVHGKIAVRCKFTEGGKEVEPEGEEVKVCLEFGRNYKPINKLAIEMVSQLSFSPVRSDDLESLRGLRGFFRIGDKFPGSTYNMVEDWRENSETQALGLPQDQLSKLASPPNEFRRQERIYKIRFAYSPNEKPEAGEIRLTEASDKIAAILKSKGGISPEKLDDLFEPDIPDHVKDRMQPQSSGAGRGSKGQRKITQIDVQKILKCIVRLGISVQKFHSNFATTEAKEAEAERLKHLNDLGPKLHRKYAKLFRKLKNACKTNDSVKITKAALALGELRNPGRFEQTEETRLLDRVKNSIREGIKSIRKQGYPHLARHLEENIRFVNGFYVYCDISRQNSWQF